MIQWAFDTGANTHMCTQKTPMSRNMLIADQQEPDVKTHSGKLSRLRQFPHQTPIINQPIASLPPRLDHYLPLPSTHRCQSNSGEAMRLSDTTISSPPTSCLSVLGTNLLPKFRSGRSGQSSLLAFLTYSSDCPDLNNQLPILSLSLRPAVWFSFSASCVCQSFRNDDHRVSDVSTWRLYSGIHPHLRGWY